MNKKKLLLILLSTAFISSCSKSVPDISGIYQGDNENNRESRFIIEPLHDEKNTYNMKIYVVYGNPDYGVKEMVYQYKPNTTYEFCSTIPFDSRFSCFIYSKKDKTIRWNISKKTYPKIN